MRVAATILVISLAATAAIALLLFLIRPGEQKRSGSATGTGDFGIFRSDDGGQNWKSASSLQGGGSLGRNEILKIIPDPHRVNTFFALSSVGGFSRTENSGDVWVSVQDENGIIPAGARVNDIAFDSQNADRWYLAAFVEKNGRFLRTEDNGKTFGQMYASAIPKVDITAVAVDSSDARTVYAGFSDGLLLQSQDFGVSWKSLYQFRGSVKQIAIPQNAPSIIFVVLGSKQGLWKTEDYGATFVNLTAISSFSGGPDIQILTLDPGNARRLFIGTAFGLLESKDGGETFIAPPLVIPARSLPVTAVAIDSQNSLRFFVGASNGFYITNDGGEHWIQKQLPTTRRIGALAVDKENPDIIYAGIKK